MDPHEILSRLGSEDNAPTDAELTQAIADFKALGRKAVEAKQPEEAATIRQAVKLLENELTARAEAEAEEAAKAAEFLADFADLWSPMDLRWLQRRRSRAQTGAAFARRASVRRR